MDKERIRILRPPCEEIATKMLPTLRALVADLLVVKYGKTQSEAAKIMGISKASVSYYRNSLRGDKSLVDQFPELLGYADIIAEGLINDQEESVAVALCELCSTLKRKQPSRCLCESS
ncbi:MAG TPA: hypothetical protein EYP68_06515 [Candidatus Korarchaeota archaeon]|nr:hypothetical protein [Candidatus Korarchaeota archaeon]